jgi:hypothetical protein
MIKIQLCVVLFLLCDFYNGGDGYFREYHHWYEYEVGLSGKHLKIMCGRAIYFYY